ncbi:MAG: hypothetical protein A2W99_15790 [Bacteroidetes bacterium GWF2_33_16]|nr:MAG: hypothetical protein A2X00_15135 [Bacteroidetes bacterium GWE2_32_14]OFY02366.1 MAG: hypothetical protein A2W99_15790 [Bacteroidetes bacterium GWF2_33_16]
MFRQSFYLLLSFLVVVLISLSGVAQNKPDTELDELKTAYIDFKNKDYSKAYIYFQKMYEQYPKDPTYNYYTGICLLFLEKNPEKALKRLRLAATNDVPYDIYFYLGIAYHNSYLFDDALKNYQWFEKKSSKNKAKEYDLQNHINKSINAKSLIASIENPAVISREKIKKKQISQQYNIKELDGRFGSHYELMKLPPDSLAEFTLMYLPNNLERNEVVYFSMRNENRGDMDIYRSARKQDGTWTEPENAGNQINTPFDDSFPYLHSDGSTLFFASKGHYSMGGYDIFKTVWNSENKQWSTPENIGFPINTPYDDFFFVPSPDEKYAFFSSSRDCNPDEANVYKIRYFNDNTKIEQIAYNELLKISKLDVNVIDKRDIKPDKNNEPRNNRSEIVTLETNEDFLFKNEYDSLLNRAMKYQMKADSLKWVIDKKRSLFGDNQTEDQKSKLTNEIIKLENDIYSMQKTADQCYERVREIEQINMASSTSAYAFKQEKTETKPVEKNQQQNSANIAKQNEKDSISFKRMEIVEIEENENQVEKSDYGFFIKIPSVYNEQNPIPTNEKLPKGIIYMIQLGAFSSVKTPASFHGFTPITCITTQGSNLRKYYTGKFFQLKEAEKYLPKVKEKGFKDSYIVAFNNGKTIPINNAIKLESKQAVVPSQNNVKASHDINANELSIQYVLRFELNNQDSILIDKIKTLVPENNKIKKELKGNILFISIEWFSNFDNAYSIKKKLEPIINKEVEVHAFFAESKIPIDQAKKMTK